LSNYYTSAIFATIESRNNSNFNKPIQFSRKIKEENISLFRQELVQTLDINLIDINSLHTFTNIFNNLTDKYFPLQKVSRRKTPLQPWITKGILNSIKTKDKLHKKFKTTNNEVNETLYKKYRNKLECVKRLAKKNYYTSEIKKFKDNPKKLWGTIKSIINKQNSITHFPTSFTLNENNKITNPKIIANEFNKYFSTIGSSLSNKLPSPDRSFESFMGNPTLSSIYLYDTNANEIEEIIRKLKSNSLCSTDLKVVLLKLMSPEIKQFLSLAINKIFIAGIFPDFLKAATVTPIYKTGDNALFSNYRPISVLPVLSKILERAIYNRMTSFINKYNILSNKQFGFRKNSSTNHALIHYHNNITHLLDNSQFVLSVFIDLKKAFDTVNHDILLNKLYYYGIRGPCYNLLQSYLQNRTQKVKFLSNNQQVISDSNYVTCGVPQGSILGPLLFLLYINDLPSISNKLEFILFADDTTITISHKSLYNLQEIANHGLKMLHNWLISNKLTINILKTNYIIFSPKNKIIPFTPLIFINNQQINNVTHIKFLGIFIDEKLSWHHHISHLTNKLARNIAILYKLQNNVTHEIMTMMYYSFIYSHLTYGITLWGNTYKTKLDPLLLLQKRAIRVISGSSYLAHTSPLFKLHKILKLDDIATFETLKFVYKYKFNLQPSTFSNYFTFSNNARNPYIIIPKHQTNYRSFSIQVQGAKVYNKFFNLHRHYFETINSFKRYFFNYILNSY
jgi:hypothetical protein